MNIEFNCGNFVILIILKSNNDAELDEFNNFLNGSFGLCLFLYSSDNKISTNAEETPSFEPIPDDENKFNTIAIDS